MDAPGAYAVHFGGPDLRPALLRDILAERVAAVPAGGEIDWATYYFRDRRLAHALLDARRRGVRVALALEEQPRTAHANRAVVRILSGADGLGEGLRLVRHTRLFLRPHLHEKLYCFSHPQPAAFIGSFNPSGDQPELEPEVVAEIRDQDRGYNVLVELRHRTVVNDLVAHARRLHRSRHGLLERFSPAANGRFRGDDTEIFFLPSVRPHPLLAQLRHVGPGAVVRIAASHIKGPTAARTLLELAGRGALVTILAEETRRRVPPSMEARLKDAGITIRRLVHPAGLPMHDKFILIDQAGQRRVVFGSFNWTERSFRLNHEIGAICTNRDVVEAFAARWQALEAQAAGSTRNTR
ncbi:MAG TPA: phosphatidylserine/phosphatidylglycerophosphate/cardiolipin synthase family protein [Methylomirabilota bacterium]|nr:phosphatidylserine/phosphatidylglycerophosphate/cardiolipin synthase family protein [Methylomirabilota bacterium]